MSFPVVEASRQAANLEECANYGMLPFDRFALHKWDYSKPRTVEEDQKQWDEIAQRWLSLDQFARYPYHGGPSERSSMAHIRIQLPDYCQNPTEEQINRVLAPHQTVFERNLSVLLVYEDCPWVRTCYEPSLVPAYHEIIDDYMEPWAEHLFLDNETLYGTFGSDTTKLFLRIPELPDRYSYHGYPEIDLPEDDFDPPKEEHMIPLYTASRKADLVLYLLDKEALEKKLIRVCWFDNMGNRVWWYWLSPDDVQSFDGYGHALSLYFELAFGDLTFCQEGGLIELD